jgi:phosphoglycolate phosphatase
MIRSVILDLDGTLIDSAAGVQDSVEHAIREVLPEYPFDRAKVRVGPPIREMARRTFPDLSPELIERISVSFRKHYDSIGWHNMRVFDGAVDALAALRKSNVDLYLATNKPLGPTRQILEDYRMAPYLNDYVAIDSTKPPFAGKAEMIRHLVEVHALTVNSTAYVGDTRGDADAAAKCGVPFIFAGYGYSSASELDGVPVWRTIDRLTDLPQCVLG